MALGATDGFLMAYNLISKLYVKSVHDLQQLIRSRTKQYEAFKRESICLQRPVKAKVAYLHTLLSGLHEHHGTYLDMKGRCQNRANQRVRVTKLFLLIYLKALII